MRERHGGRGGLMAGWTNGTFFGYEDPHLLV